MAPGGRGFGGLAELAAALVSPVSSACSAGVGDGGAVMPEGQELLRAGGGLQGGVQERVGDGDGPWVSVVRP